MKKLNIFLFMSFVLVLTSFMSGHAKAGQPRLMETYGAWDVYVFFEDGQKVCYIASQPKTKEGTYKNRSQPFALVTHRPAENTRDVFSYITGYPYKSGSNAKLQINSKNFSLFTQNETAWATDSQTDSAIAKAIREGSKMVVKGTSSKGTTSTDTFSLSGSSKAYERMSKECK